MEDHQGRAAAIHRAAVLAARLQVRHLADQQEQEPQVGRHLGVECDECGENPILGTRFKCLTRRNYDVCRQCWQDNHGGVDDGTFCRTEARLTYTQTRLLEPNTAKRSVMVYSLANLANELNNDPTLEDLTFYPQGVSMTQEAEVARKALTNHKGLKSFHIYTRSCQDVDTVVQIVAEGLLSNQSVFSAGFSVTTNTSFQNLAKPTVKALQNLMLANRHIKFLFVKRPRSHSLEHSANYNNLKFEQDDLESALFEALASTQLQTFRLEAHTPVSDENKKRAWNAMESNPSLKRICARFEHDDNQLQTLTADKKHEWMKRWAQMDGSDQQRLDVLEEVRNKPELDTLNALYRLVRGQPGSLLETVQEMCMD